MTATGQPFSLRFAMVITVRDGQIVHSRDYSDPIAAPESWAGSPSSSPS
jgi:ketosteroid isomerase-like protein